MLDDEVDVSANQDEQGHGVTLWEGMLLAVAPRFRSDYCAGRSLAARLLVNPPNRMLASWLPEDIRRWRYSAHNRPALQRGELPPMTARLRSRLARVSRALLLGAAALFYLQFGLQAMFHSPPQGVLTLVGALALGWAAVRIPRKWSRSAIVLAGTLPLLVLHAVFTLIDPGELPFLIGSAPVPVIAGAVWISTRSSSSDGLATEE